MSTVYLPRSSTGSVPRLSKAIVTELDTGEIQNPDDSYVEIKDRIYVVDGAASAPAYSFSSDTDSGIYRSTGSVITSVDGTARLTVGTSSMLSSTPILAPDGAASAPAYSFSSDTDTGIYRPASNQLALVTGGTARLTMDNIFVTSSLAINAGTNAIIGGQAGFESYLAGTGSASAPSYSFGADSTSGIYRNTSGAIITSIAGSSKFAVSDTSISMLTDVGMGSNILSCGPVSCSYITASGTISSGAITSSGSIRSGTSSAAAPAFCFSGSTTSGLYSSATGVVDVSAAGTQVLTMASTYVKSPVQPYIQLSPTVNTPQSLTSGVETTLTYWTVEESRTGFAAASGGTITAPVAGVYLISATVSFANNTTGNRMANICIGGVRKATMFSPTTSGADNCHIQVSLIVSLAANDVISIKAQQSSGGSLNAGDITNNANGRQLFSARLLV